MLCLSLMFVVQFGMMLVPGGLFMYGWTAQSHTYFLVPLIAAAISSFGILIGYVRVLRPLVPHVNANSHFRFPFKRT